jgi:general secretion pathway protein J
MQRPQRAVEGFTMLEIIVALFILGIIVAAIYSTWMAVVKGADTGKRVAAEVQRSRIAIRVLEDALTCTRMFAADPDYYSFEAENGDQPTLSFVARLSDSFPRSGKFGSFNVRRLTFTIEPGATGSGNELVLRQNPVLMDMLPDEQNYPLVLARNVTKFEMAFWDVRKIDWVDEWTLTNQLPPLVRITLETGGKDSFSDVRQSVTKEISLATTTVPANWQGVPAQPGGPRRGGPGQLDQQPVNPGQRRF